MSTKTTFKRIALVAVAALGLGVLSVAPSNAAYSNLTVTATAGTATTSVSDSSTAAAVTVSYLGTDKNDSATIQIVRKSSPTGAATFAPTLMFDTTTASGVGTQVQTTSAVVARYETTTTNTWNIDSVTLTSAGYRSASFKIMLDTSTAGNNYALTAGTYTTTIIVTPYNAGSVYNAGIVTTDVNIVVSAVASASDTANAGNSTAVMYAGTSFVANNTVDSSVAAVATASATEHATIRVALKNTAGGYAQESITATITGAGTIGNASIGGAAGTGVSGKSIVVAMTSNNYVDLDVYADGTAGVATISISSTSVTFAAKTVTFYAKSPKTITAAVYNPVLTVGANATAIAATAVDANGTNWTGQLYVVASSATDALVGGSATAPVACSYNSTYATHFCPVTTLTTGTAKFKVVDQSLDADGTYAAADSAATSNEVTVTVSNAAANSVKLAFDKATYQPFERALITVTVLDANGKPRQGATYSNLFATGGITANQAFGSASDTLTAVSVTTESANGTDATAGAKTYVVYMPAQGDVTISATGGVSLAPAGQVKVTATASVVNSSVDAATDAANEATDAANAATDAALAAADAADAATAAAQDASDAVAALSASVSKMISNLRAQITSLTNLVIKIQKKVRA
jgi:trimeric autotransporter adhesin